jgi:transposase
MCIEPFYLGNVVGLDIRQNQVTAGALLVEPDGQNVSHEFREYNWFVEDLNKMAEWIASLTPDIVVMEIAGKYWLSLCKILHKHGVIPTEVNARDFKNVPAKKNYPQKCLWLAHLARFGLLKPILTPSPARGKRKFTRRR